MNLNKLKQKTLTLVIIEILVVLTVLAPAIVIKPAYAAWWNSDWAYRKPITIDHTKVAADLTNFPTLIDLTDSDLQTKAQSDGDDIVFTDYNGTKLNHEIELYTAATGKLVAWVNIPSLSSSTDTVLYMYYGNSTVLNQENPSAVWNSDYRMVQHLSETSGLHYDSTTNGNNGTYYGSQQGIAGKLDGADGFIGNFASAGSGDYIDCKNATSLNINQAITVSAWIKSNDQTLWNHIATKGCDSPNRVYQLSIEANEQIDFIINGDATNAKATTIKTVTIGEWSYVVGTYDRSNVKTFINGVENASKAWTSAINNNTVNLRIASRVYGTGNTGSQYSTFHGSIDEVRVTAVARSSGWILTEFNNQNSPSTFYSVGSEESETPPPPPPPAPWWNTHWLYRKNITINHLMVKASLASFPVLINVVDPDLKAKAQADGDDIVFTDYNGTKLNHEIELYTAATGKLVAWVNIPSLSSSTDTVLYMYYGNSTVASQENVAGVWGSEYRMVQHLSESSGLHYDSSQYGNNGTYYGSQQGIAGKLDGADSFVGNLGTAGGDYVDCGNSSTLNINDAITVSAWIKPTDQTQWNHVVTKGCDAPNRAFQLSIETDERIDFVLNGDSVNAIATTVKTVNTGQWSYVVGTYDRSSIRVFLDGVENASKAYMSAINNVTVNLRIAGRVYGTGNSGPSAYTFDGAVDEVRLCSVARNANWILTEFNNQNNPSGFYTFGAEESIGTPPPPPQWWNTYWLYRKSITINHLSVASNLTDFPVFVNITDEELASKAQLDGDDIAFTDINGTKLDHEIEYYNSTMGRLVAWVRIPQLSSTTDTELFVYYGNPSSGSQQNAAYVWDLDYRMVQHLSESSGLHYDSTTNGNNGTYNGSQQGITGKLDGADGFIGNLGAAGGDYVDCGNSSSLNINDAITVSAWIKPTDQTQWNHITTKGCDLPNRVYQLSIEANEQIDFIINGDVNFMKATTSVSVPIGAWSYVVGTYDRNNIKVYIDGVERISVANTTAINTNTVNLRIASRITGTGNTGLPAFTFDGVIDEVRVSSLARSADWIETEYNSQNNPAEFFTFGAEEAAPFTAQFVAPTPDDAATILTTTATINISTNMNLSSSNLIWWSNPPVDFQITIDSTLQSQWGFQYPVTYIFNIPDGSSGVEVFKRQNAYDSWSKLPEKTSAEFFNGIECVRFDAAQDRAYVSVGFNTTDKIYLRFTNVAWVTYSSIARYYDNRKATYTLSNDNWGKVSSANPGATWQGMTDDDSDSYQAAIHAARMFNLPISIAINTYMAGGSSMWQRMQEELSLQDYSWEPAVHARTHPNSAGEYSASGYNWEILGCRDDILANLTNIPYGNYVFEFVLPSGYQDNTLQSTSQGEFLFLRDWTGSSNPSSTDYSPWNTAYEYYGIGGWETKSYDSVLQSLSPSGTYNLAAVNELNSAFDTVYNSGGIFYAMFHSDRYQNSIIYNASPNSSTLMEHFRYLSNRKDVWYVANGWLYSYQAVAERASINLMSPEAEQQPMIIHNEDTNTFAYYTMTGLTPGETYHYQVECNNTFGQSILTPERTFTVAAEIDIDLQAIGINVKTNGCSIYANDTYVNGTSYYYPVEVTVRNNGTQGSGSFFVKLEAYWINGSLTEGYNEIEVTALEGKTDLIVNFTGFFRPSHAGAYRLTVTVDSHSSISEKNETNNEYSKSDVSVTVVGDINNDGTVNIFDAVIISLAWNATPSDPQWNVKADINHDNSVDIYDATRISLHWGERT